MPPKQSSAQQSKTKGKQPNTSKAKGLQPEATPAFLPLLQAENSETPIETATTEAAPKKIEVGCGRAQAYTMTHAAIV